MNRKHHVARLLIDIDDNVDDQSPQQLLPSPHGDARRIPSPAMNSLRFIE
jgi:hypothetical protein